MSKKKRTPWNYYIAPRLTDAEAVDMARFRRIEEIKTKLKQAGVL